MRMELDTKQEVMRSLQETALCLCQENHPAKQTVEVNNNNDNNINTSYCYGSTHVTSENV